MGFIFFNSAVSGDKSAGFSEIVVTVLLNIAGWFGSGVFIQRIQEFIGGESFHIVIRKAAHFTEFGILGLLVTGYLGKYIKIRDNACKRIGSVVSLCLAYAVSDEIHQIFVLGRACSAWDVAIDVSGALVFSFILWKIIKRRQAYE